MNKKSGIYKSETDNVQPYQVWWNGSIHWFAYTMVEAELKLREIEKEQVDITLTHKINSLRLKPDTIPCKKLN